LLFFYFVFRIKEMSIQRLLLVTRLHPYLALLAIAINGAFIWALQRFKKTGPWPSASQGGGLGLLWLSGLTAEQFGIFVIFGTWLTWAVIALPELKKVLAM
jgi:hypothetical protein